MKYRWIDSDHDVESRAAQDSAAFIILGGFYANSDLKADMQLLHDCLSQINADIAPEVAKIVFGLLDFPEKFVSLQSGHSAAVRTGEFIVTFQPSDRLRSLAAAALGLTRNTDLLVIEESSAHGSPLRSTDSVPDFV